MTFKSALLARFVRFETSNCMCERYLPECLFSNSCVSDLKIDFNEVFKRTNTSYKPILIEDDWYSDYKSSSSVERIEAFIKLDRDDPVSYADETGPVSYSVAKAHAEQVLKEHAA